MDNYERHQRVWHLLWHFHRILSGVFRLEYEPIRISGPILLVVNHVTACDPLLVGMALGQKQVYFVASDHILRQGLAGRLLQWGFGPIPRRKGASAMLTAKECLRHLRAGHSVCIFAEGEQSWDGRSIPAVKGTGSLALEAGAALVTYRLEGGYFSLPRWGKGLRRGRVRGRVTGVYTPEALAGMGKDRINRALNEGIREDAWKRQREEMIRYHGRQPAEKLERCLYLCPGCWGIGTLRSRGSRLSCGCGFTVQYTDTGYFEPAVPFPTIADWEDWQKEQLRQRRFQAAGDGMLFSDPDAALSRIDGENRAETLVKRAEIRQYEDHVACGDYVFPLRDIRDMAMTQADRLLFSIGDRYYQIRTGGGANLRKYLEIWNEQSGKGDA